MSSEEDSTDGIPEKALQRKMLAAEFWMIEEDNTNICRGFYILQSTFASF